MDPKLDYAILFVPYTSTVVTVERGEIGESVTSGETGFGVIRMKMGG